MKATNGAYADIVLLSNAVFTGAEDEAAPGYVAVCGESISAVGPKSGALQWIGPETKVYELGDGLVMPGIHDNHVFFTGYMSMHRGLDLSAAASSREALDMLSRYAETLPAHGNVYAFGWDAADWGGLPEQGPLDKAFPDRAVIAINRNKSYCWMNAVAIGKYGFTPDRCSAEDRALLLRDMLRDRELVEAEFLVFCRMLAGRGVTSVKDIGFDDYAGLLPVLAELEENGRLPLRVHFALEPVLEPLNVTAGLDYKARYRGDKLRFQGFKIMVDGVVADHTGDMLEPYADLPGVTNLRPVDYEAIEAAVMEADRHGLKCILTAEGDAAIRRAVSMLEKCRKLNGDRDIRHSISDLEYPHPDDLTRMADLGIFAEVYAQILLLNPSREQAYMAEVAGKDKECRFYDYKAMLDAGVTVTIGTDLPLFITSVPDSLYAATARLFPDGSPEGGWYPERGMPAAEVLRAWTVNGAKHCYMEEQTGTLAPGKYADIAVFDRNLLRTPAADLRSAKALLTISGGLITHDEVGQTREFRE
ncbi:amidohydrolase [Paenibacillus macerans]|uniref:Amidohydrolase family protein n=1 Tax=Paenibacillus macerans TaxID=44252 RepID=A0A090Z3F2_PAEMA|nr:amidohydrolase family protein [Paenibacillus macerans]KFN05804.1 amidohydrolase family protein [Paenibacillus macerans]MCY7557940.1 amidohydrolase family protein [Paenibacillus macerans]MEC0152659.1 amidohydrolase family protein [Paenibacillus macerans]SUA85347.1 putative amidohydrolase ytcJ [Paenibacillus macerans]